MFLPLKKNKGLAKKKKRQMKVKPQTHETHKYKEQKIKLNYFAFSKIIIKNETHNYILFP